MSVNSSSSSNLTLSPPYPFFPNCFASLPGNYIFTAYTVINTLFLLPLSILILHLGLRRWRQQRSALTSHCDIMTYHMAAMEIISILASIYYCIGVYTDHLKMMSMFSHVFFSTSCGQMSFHTLTCVERYLAVVHPITYMHQRKGNKVKIRNILLWVVWLVVFAQIGHAVVQFNTDVTVMVFYMQQVFSLAVVAYCSLAVLRVLRRPGPAEGAGVRQRVDLSKQKAFNTIMAIMGTLLIRFGGNLVCTALYSTKLMSVRERCVLIDSSFWFSVPSSLAPPLLFLHRAGKLPCCENNTESGAS